MPAKEAINVLADKLGRLAWDVTETTKVPFGTYRGLQFGLMRRPQFSPDLYLEGKAVRQAMLERKFSPSMPQSL